MTRTTFEDIEKARATGDPLDLFEAAARCLEVCWPSKEGPLPTRSQMEELVKAARAMKNPGALLATVCDQRDFFAKRVEELEAALAKAPIAGLLDSACVTCFNDLDSEEKTSFEVASCNICGHSMGEGG